MQLTQQLCRSLQLAIVSDLGQLDEGNHGSPTGSQNLLLVELVFRDFSVVTLFGHFGREIQMSKIEIML